MSNPCINRWGLNSFWHHYWYSDTRYASSLHQDALLNTMIHTYITYGSNTNNTRFFNTYWYKKHCAPKPRNMSTFSRWLTAYSYTLRTTNYYKMRTESEERFHSRISILRFQSWILINLYWFQPDKKRKQRIKSAKLYHRLSTSTSANTSSSNLTKFSNLVNVSKSLTYEF